MSGVTDELPDGWTSASLDELVEIVRGITFPSSEKQPQGTRGTVACLRTSNVQDELEWDDVLYVSSEFVKRADQWLQQGDTVISMANSYELVGKVAFASHVPERATFGGFLAVLRARGFDAAYLFNLLRHPLVRDAIQQTASRTVNIANISLKGLGPIELPLAPLPEQRRIVAKIEALQARSRKAREALEAIPPLLEQFRQSVLAAAFRGDLTAAWREQHPDVEPASVLLHRIRTERRRKWEQSELAKFKAKGKVPKDDSWKEKYVEPEPVDDTDLPELPEGWCWVNIDMIASKVSDGVHKKPNYLTTGIPFLSVKNLTGGNGISFEDVKFVSKEDHDEFIKRTHPENGDILVTKDGTLGVIRLITCETTFSIFVSLALIKSVLPETSPFTTKMLESPQGQSGMKATGTGLQHIHLVDLRATVIPFPPLEEQKEIVRVIDERQMSISALTDLIADSQSEQTSLDQSILAKAFRGELVPQDPNDEPASVLLERIQAERAAESSTKTSRLASKPKRQRGTNAK